LKRGIKGQTMNSFMIDIELPEVIEDDFMQLVPYQRATINKLMKRGIISNYSLSFDRRKLWVVMNAESVKDVKMNLASFPIYKYITFKIYSLLFHESNSMATPHFWLN
jgi:muconolactone delta-isomerase